MEGKLRNMTSLYIRKGDKLLMLYRTGSRVISDSYTGTAGGHFEKEELNDARACALRELQEETGLCELNIANLKLRYITLRLKNGEVRQSYYFFADINMEETGTLDSDEGRLEWFEEGDVLKLNMPHSAKYMMEHYLREGKYTDFLYGGVATEKGVEFVQLQEF